MNGTSIPIGIGQRIRLEWLEQTAGLVMAGNDRQTVTAVLQEQLQEMVAAGSTAPRNSREKGITVLLRVWLQSKPEHQPLRQTGLELLSTLSGPNRLVVHWGMISAVYPFWALVAIQVGRLLRLQDTVAAEQIQRRVRERLGERESVSRSTHWVIRSMIDWGVLAETGKKGWYRAGMIVPVDDIRLVAWVIESILHASGKQTAVLDEVFSTSSLFPFQLRRLGVRQLQAVNPRLEFVRQGLAEDLVMLAGKC